MKSISNMKKEKKLKKIKTLRTRAIAVVEAMQKQSLRNGTDRITLREINEEIAVVRNTCSR